MGNSVTFSRLMEEYGSIEVEEPAEGGRAEKARLRRKDKKIADDEASEEAGPKKVNIALMQTEERNTGAVTWSVYRDYLRYAGGVFWAPFILFWLTVAQAAQGMYSELELLIIPG